MSSPPDPNHTLHTAQETLAGLRQLASLHPDDPFYARAAQELLDALDEVPPVRPRLASKPDPARFN